MLSYMNEQGGNKEQDVNVGASETETPTVSQETSDFAQESPDGEQDHIKLAEHGKAAKRSAVVLASLFAVGVLCLWVMIKKIAPADADAAPSAGEVQIEQAIAQLTGIRSEVNSKMDSIVGKFYEFSKVDQVRVSELKRNPFRHTLGFTDIGKSGFGMSKEMLLAEEVRDRAEQMDLFSIMQDGNGVSSCIIEDKLLYSGDSINNFTVRKIGAKYVELEHNDTLVTLKIAE